MRIVLAFLISFVAVPVSAATTCTFTTECLEGEACSASNYVLDHAARDGKTRILTTGSETLTGFAIGSGNSAHFIFEAPSAAHLLTEYSDGAARYTIHMDGPFSITYHGTCEDAT